MTHTHTVTPRPHAPLALGHTGIKSLCFPAGPSRICFGVAYKQQHFLITAMTSSCRESLVCQLHFGFELQCGYRQLSQLRLQRLLTFGVNSLNSDSMNHAASVLITASYSSAGFQLPQCS